MGIIMMFYIETLLYMINLDISFHCFFTLLGVISPYISCVGYSDIEGDLRIYCTS